MSDLLIWLLAAPGRAAWGYFGLFQEAASGRLLPVAKGSNRPIAALRKGQKTAKRRHSDLSTHPGDRLITFPTNAEAGR